jgi:hypothetical protein
VIAAIERPDVEGVLTAGNILIGSNRATEDLAEHGARVLPVIENVLLTDAPRWFASPDRYRVAFGLDDVMHLYAELAHRHDWRPAGQLLKELKGELRELLLIAFHQGYGQLLGERRWRPVPDWLKTAVHEICRAGESEVARRIQQETSEG